MASSPLLFNVLSPSSLSGNLSVNSTAPSINQELSKFYYVGSSITLFASLFMMFSYIKFQACRTHPSSLIFWRSLFDVIFSLQFIILLSTSNPSDPHCDVFSFIIQFSALGSQSWYFMNAVDLLRSLRNPFTDPATNAKFYHLYVWTMSLVTSLAIVASNNEGYRYDMQICWTKLQGAFNYMNWITFFFPMMFYYGFSLLTIIYAGFRLKIGLKDTFKVREVVLHNGIRYVAGFCVYWTFAGIIYVTILQQNGDGNPLALYATFAFTIAFRGIIDVGVWCYNQEVIQTYNKWWNKTLTLSMDEIKDTDINKALRTEVLKFSTAGIVLSVNKANEIDLPEISSAHYPTSLNFDHTQERSLIPMNVSREDSSSDQFVPFLDYAPQVFRFLRAHYGIEENDYKRSIQGKTEAMIEKFTEGRSGSFFYFSEDMKYIVKTLTTGEARFLIKWLPDYVNYMKHHRNSLISRFVGFHAITLYNLTIHFIVMQSVFLTDRKIHERYDLKGSFVDRHAGQPKPGKSATYKDSDLNRCIRLNANDRENFLKQIEMDARFLASCNIMDYSLLLGIHQTRQLVIPMKSSSIPRHLSSVELLETASHVFQRDAGGLQAEIIEGPGIYFFGLIDILQEYNTSKKLERLAKIYLRFKNPHGISSMPPQPYCERFIKAMKRITTPPPDENDNLSKETTLSRVELNYDDGALDGIDHSRVPISDMYNERSPMLSTAHASDSVLTAGSNPPAALPATHTSRILDDIANRTTSINSTSSNQPFASSHISPNSSSLSTTTVFASFASSSSTTSNAHSQPMLYSLGITDSAHDTRPTLASSSGWSSI